MHTKTLTHTRRHTHARTHTHTHTHTHTNTHAQHNCIKSEHNQRASKHTAYINIIIVSNTCIHCEKAFLNRWVIRLDLKAGRDGQRRRDRGSLFPTRSDTNERQHPPWSSLWNFGALTNNNKMPSGTKVRWGLFFFTRRERDNLVLCLLKLCTTSSKYYTVFFVQLEARIAVLEVVWCSVLFLIKTQVWQGYFGWVALAWWLIMIALKQCVAVI